LTLRTLEIIVLIASIPVIFWIFSACYTVLHHFRRAMASWRLITGFLDLRRDLAQNLVKEIGLHFYYDPKITEIAAAMHFIYAPYSAEKRCARQELEQAYLIYKAIEMIEVYPAPLFDYWLPDIKGGFFDLDSIIERSAIRYNFNVSRFNSLRYGFLTSSIASYLYPGELPLVRFVVDSRMEPFIYATGAKEKKWRSSQDVPLCSPPACANCAHLLSAFRVEERREPRIVVRQ
jgi:hypothetical protein